MKEYIIFLCEEGGMGEEHCSSYAELVTKLSHIRATENSKAHVLSVMVTAQHGEYAGFSNGVVVRVGDEL